MALHENNLWLLFSRQSQWARNSSAQCFLISASLCPPRSSSAPSHTAHGDAGNLHRRSTSRDLSPLPQTLHFSLPPRLVLAEHEVLIIVFAPGTDEVCGGQQRGARRADLLHLWDGVREWRRVYQAMLVDPVYRSSINSPDPQRRGASEIRTASFGKWTWWKMHRRGFQLHFRYRARNDRLNCPSSAVLARIPRAESSGRDWTTERQTPKAPRAVNTKKFPTRQGFLLSGFSCSPPAPSISHSLLRITPKQPAHFRAVHFRSFVHIQSLRPREAAHSLHHVRHTIWRPAATATTAATAAAPAGWRWPVR